MNKVFYFSGTGNSYYIAKRVASSLKNTEIRAINCYNDKEEVKVNGDTIGIVFPVYYGDAPNVVNEFYKKLKINNSAYVYLITNMAAKSYNTIPNGISTLKRQGIDVQAGFDITLPGNSIVLSTKPNKIERVRNEAESAIENVIDAIKKRVNNRSSKNYLYYPINGMIKSMCIHYLGFNRMKVDKSRCNSCGTCEKVCPMNNIKLEGETIRFDNKCEMCFACIHRCPQKAIGYKKMNMDKDYQIVNPNIDVKEMMWR